MQGPNGIRACCKDWHPALTAVPAIFAAAAKYVFVPFQLCRAPLPLAPSLPFPSPRLLYPPHPTPPPLSHRPCSALQLGMYSSDALEPGKASSATASLPLSVSCLAPLSPTVHTLLPPPCCWALQLGMHDSDALEPGKASSATANLPDVEPFKELKLKLVENGGPVHSALYVEKVRWGKQGREWDGDRSGRPVPKGVLSCGDDDVSQHACD